VRLAAGTLRHRTESRGGIKWDSCSKYGNLTLVPHHQGGGATALWTHTSLNGGDKPRLINGREFGRIDFILSHWSDIFIGAVGVMRHHSHLLMARRMHDTYQRIGINSNNSPRIGITWTRSFGNPSVD